MGLRRVSAAADADDEMGRGGGKRTAVTIEMLHCRIHRRLLMLIDSFSRLHSEPCLIWPPLPPSDIVTITIPPAILVTIDLFSSFLLDINRTECADYSFHCK